MKKRASIILLYLIVSILIAPIRSFGNTGVKISTIVGFVLYFSLTAIFIKRDLFKISPSILLAMGLIGISVINLPFHVIHFKATLGTLVEYIVHLGAVLAGYYYMRINKLSHRVIFSGISVSIVAFIVFCLYDLILKVILY